MILEKNISYAAMNQHKLKTDIFFFFCDDSHKKKITFIWTEWSKKKKKPAKKKEMVPVRGDLLGESLVYQTLRSAE